LNSAPVRDGTSDRSAHASIRGYVYQFDRTIIEILLADSGTSILVEGLEDVDLHGADRLTAVQVKYWSSRAYATPRSLHEPIEPMIEAYSKGATHDFILHVHFGTNGVIPTRLSADEIKSCLTRTTRNPKASHLDYEKYSPEVIEGFAKKLKIRQGKEFSEQRADVINLLSERLKISQQDAIDVYYPNAFALVAQLAMKQVRTERRIEPESFVLKIDVKDSLYARWHAEVVGVERYVKGISRRLRAGRALDAAKSKALVMNVEGPDKAVLEIMRRLAKHEFGPGKLHTTMPWTLIVNGTNEAITQLKIAALRESIVLQDGFEHLEFQTHVFDRSPVINRRNRSDAIKNSSYDLRIIGMPSLEKYACDGYAFDVLIAIEQPKNKLFDRASKSPPIFVRGVGIEHIHELIGGKS
jgi:hypothetical protein